MKTPEEVLQELGLLLQPPAAAGVYVPAVRTGNLLFLSGTLPMREGALAFAGKVAVDEESIARAREAARLCVANALANARAAAGSLAKVARVVSLTGYVNGEDGFSEAPKVLNGASELLLAVFGEAGCHTRAAVSVNGLPLNSSVETSLVLELVP